MHNVANFITLYFIAHYSTPGLPCTLQNILNLSVYDDRNEAQNGMLAYFTAGIIEQIQNIYIMLTIPGMLPQYICVLCDMCVQK